MATNAREQPDSPPPSDDAGLEPARTHGMLMEVNWREGTAQLHPTRPFPGERYVSLRFPAALGADMLRSATRFVTVRGKARFNENDEYEVFHVEEVIPPRGNKPFSREELLEEMRKNPNPFVPGAVPRMHIPREEAEEFIRVILEARDVP